MNKIALFDLSQDNPDLWRFKKLTNKLNLKVLVVKKLNRFELRFYKFLVISSVIFFASANNIKVFSL